ncbi:MAG: substrate-binding domain-containing protein [Oscillospiraceae bacterium]
MRKLKSLLATLVVGALLTAGIAGCASNSTASSAAASGSATSTAAAGETFKVFLITMDQMDQHWVNVNAGAEKAASELGNVELKWLAPDVKDDAKQIEMVNQAVADDAQAIIIAANGPDAITAALTEAQNAGVKIVYIDSPANIPALQTIATDNKAAGATAGEQMKAALEEAGVTSGTIGLLNTNAASISTLDREEGFRSVFDGTDFEVLPTQYTEGDPAKSKDAASNFISQGVVGLFGANEGTTVGVGNAIQEAGSDVVGVGFDKSDMILNLVKSGALLATMAQNPDLMGYEGVMTAVKALRGEEISPDYVDSGVTVITAANVDSVQ